MGQGAFLLPCLFSFTLNIVQKGLEALGDNQAKAAKVDIGLRKQKPQPVRGTQPVRQTGGAHTLEALQRAEAEVDREIPSVGTSEGACKT